MDKSFLSIVTPSYNRSTLLHQCFESLKKQTCFDFEWIIVDDGSTDNTSETVRNLSDGFDLFKIQYVYKKNGGKHTAMNASHPYINGDYVLILDSDDYLTPEAVQTVLDSWKTYSEDASIGTLIFLRGDPEGNPRAYGAREGVPDDYRNLKRISVTSSDCCEVFRKSLFTAYPYSVFEGERFISESELWNRAAADGYKCVYVNKVIYIGEYLNDGLTNAGRKMRIRNPLGGMTTSALFIDSHYSWKMRIKKTLLYVMYGYFAKLSIGKIMTFSKGHYVLKALCLLPAYMLYLSWKKKYS